MHLVDDDKDNGLNNFFNYFCGIFGEVCNLASATNNDVLDLRHYRTGHDSKNMIMECVK